MTNLIDSYNRLHDYLRISLTDKCNLKCSYCTPFQKTGFNNKFLLTYEELHRVIKIFIQYLGIRKIRFTGGEPLIRKDISEFFKMISNDCKNVKLGITTNGILLADNLHALKESGITLLNISLDSLRKDTFKEITGYDGLETVLNAIEQAYKMEFRPLKINCVVLRNKNFSEINDFVRLTENKNINVRFIEYMPFDNNDWKNEEFVGTDELIQTIKNEFKLTKEVGKENSTSIDYTIKGHKGKISFISPLSHGFCSSCSRLRLTADGKFKPCLFSTKDEDYDLKWMLSSHMFSDSEIASTISEQLKYKKFIHPEIDELITLNRDNMISIGG